FYFVFHNRSISAKTSDSSQQWRSPASITDDGRRLGVSPSHGRCDRLDRMGWLLTLVFAELASAGRARRDDSIAVARLDLVVEYVGDGAAHREMLRFVAERTRHPTTARIERVDRVARPSKHAHGVMILLRCLLMAMAVIDERFVLFGEVDRLVESEAVDVF